MYLQERGINTVTLQQKSMSHDSEVNYVHNHVEFIATNDQELILIKKLQATGLVIERKPCDQDCTLTTI